MLMMVWYRGNAWRSSEGLIKSTGLYLLCSFIVFVFCLQRSIFFLLTGLWPVTFSYFEFLTTLLPGNQLSVRRGGELIIRKIESVILCLVKNSSGFPSYITELFTRWEVAELSSLDLEPKPMKQWNAASKRLLCTRFNHSAHITATDFPHIISYNGAYCLVKWSVIFWS